MAEKQRTVGLWDVKQTTFKDCQYGYLRLIKIISAITIDHNYVNANSDQSLTLRYYLFRLDLYVSNNVSYK